MQNEEDNSLRIDLLEKGQKLEQFTDMVNNRYLLDDYQVEGASPNFFTTKVFNRHSNVLQGFYSAYENHLPICLTPDIIWLLIVQGFSQHVNFNSKYLREKFVNFENKKKLEIIITKYNSYKQMKPEDYENLFESLVGKIKEYVGEELLNTLDFNFSTSNKITKVVGYTSIMSSMKKYFEYQGFCHLCNYPYIILKGKLEDWENILKKAKELAKYDLKYWVENLEPILLKIIEAKKGHIDKNFWKEIIYPEKVDEKIEYETYKYKTIKVNGIKGWLLTFFPYFNDGYTTNLKSLKIKELWKIPDKLLRTPLIMKSDKEGETKMTIYSGFFGMNVDTTKDNLVTAEIGWYVKKKSKINENKDYLHKKNFHPFHHFSIFGMSNDSDED